jgi:2-isopropylmalate synthase
MTLFLVGFVFQFVDIYGQETTDALPIYIEEEVKQKADWLINSDSAFATLYQDDKENLVFSNGLVSRTFSVAPDVATIGFDNLVSGESILRSVRQEAEVTINGIGERAGNTSLEEVVMALHTRQNILPATTNVNTEYIHPTSRLVSMITGIMVQPNKAIVGANAFAHEAGIHQDGVLKNRMTYEIMKPETIGLSTNKLVLGKHSGRHALHAHLKDMGYDLSSEELNLVFKKFKELADKKKHIVDEDLEVIVTEGILRTSDVFQLEYLHVIAGTTVLPMASVKLQIQGRSVQSAGYGNGPIDAAFNTIASLTGTESELLRFSISALTVGTDAQGEVTVRLRENGLTALGKGADPDIITASARAYVNGLNRLEYLKSHPAKEAAGL